MGLTPANNVGYLRQLADRLHPHKPGGGLVSGDPRAVREAADALELEIKRLSGIIAESTGSPIADPMVSLSSVLHHVERLDALEEQVGSLTENSNAMLRALRMLGDGLPG